jgi:hypothetical protein
MKVVGEGDFGGCASKPTQTYRNVHSPCADTATPQETSIDLTIFHVNK